MAGKKILIIDMDAASRSFVGAVLQKEGYQTLEAASGREGLVVAWRDRPDLLIIDPDLTDLPGETLALRLRQDARTAHTPLIALSSDPNRRVSAPRWTQGSQNIWLRPPKWCLPWLRQ